MVILGLGYIFFGRTKVDPAMQKQLAELQLLKVQIEQQRSDLDAKAKIESDKTTQLQKQLSESKSVEDKARIQKQLEEAQARKLEVERQQKLADQRLADQKLAEQKLAEQKKAAETKVTAPPVPEAPKPQPMQEAQRPAAVPAQQVPTPLTGAPQTMVPAVNNDQPARVVSQVAPAFPLRAVQMRWETNVDHYVRLKVFVSEQGQPLKVSVIEGVSGAYGFDEAAIEAANKATFSPAIRDNKPVRGWTPEIVYKFPKRR